MDIGSVPFDAKAIHERIKIMRRGCSDKQLFWRLMACFCARKLLDAVEDTDAAAFSSFVDEAFANLKMKATFRKYEELSLVLDRRTELGHAIATFADAKRKALCDALADAARDYFGRPSAAGRVDAARHGLVVVSADQHAQSLQSGCEQAVSHARVVVTVVGEQADPTHIANMLERADEIDGPALLLVVSHATIAHCADHFPWCRFALLAEFDQLPEMHRLRAHLEPRLRSVLVVPRAEAQAEARVEAGAETGAGAAVGHTAEEAPADVARDEAVSALRDAQNKTFDEVITLQPPTPDTTPSEPVVPLPLPGTGAAILPVGAPSSDHPAILSILAGESILNVPRLHRLLSQHGVRVVETSMQARQP